VRRCCHGRLGRTAGCSIWVSELHWRAVCRVHAQSARRPSLAAGDWFISENCVAEEKLISSIHVNWTACVANLFPIDSGYGAGLALARRHEDRSPRRSGGTADSDLASRCSGSGNLQCLPVQIFYVADHFHICQPGIMCAAGPDACRQPAAGSTYARGNCPAGVGCGAVLGVLTGASACIAMRRRSTSRPCAQSRLLMAHDNWQPLVTDARAPE